MGATSLSDRTNQVSVICHLSSSCRDKPNLPKFFSSNWKTSWLKPRANAFCWVPPSTHHAALPKQPTRFPAPRGHRLSSRFEAPALPMKFMFPPPYVISVALVFCRVPPTLPLTTAHNTRARRLVRNRRLVECRPTDGAELFSVKCSWSSERLQKDHVICV